jgi:hypothetical protein
MLAPLGSPLNRSVSPVNSYHVSVGPNNVGPNNVGPNNFGPKNAGGEGFKASPPRTLSQSDRNQRNQHVFTVPLYEMERSVSSMSLAGKDNKTRDAPPPSTNGKYFE